MSNKTLDYTARSANGETNFTDSDSESREEELFLIPSTLLAKLWPGSTEKLEERLREFLGRAPYDA